MSSENDTEHVAARVRSELRERKISQEVVAVALGMTQQAVSRRVTGEVDFSVPEFTALAALMGVSVSWLLEGSPAEEVA